MGNIFKSELLLSHSAQENVIDCFREKKPNGELVLETQLFPNITNEAFQRIRVSYTVYLFFSFRTSANRIYQD